MKAAVLGSPISHSLSPVLHRAAYRSLGLAGWSYEAIECDETRLPGLLAGCGPDWAGLSLTMPLKRAVLPLLDHAGPLVREVGAANTVVFHGGARHGHNTDVPGMVAALAEGGVENLEGRDPHARPGQAPAGGVLILGAGATACSALAAVRDMGATHATVAVRDRSRAGDLLGAAARLGVTVSLRSLADPGQTAPDLLISTLPAGAADFYAERLARGTPAPRWVLDVVYDPCPTALAAAARTTGSVVVDGFGLLLHQAAGQVTLMTGKQAPVEAMRAAGRAALSA